MTVDNFIDHYHNLKNPTEEARAVSPYRSGTKKLAHRDEPTLANTFGWSSTYIPYFDKINSTSDTADIGDDFEIVDKQDAESPIKEEEEKRPESFEPVVI